jgi:CDP-diacylglycerol--glycerol-3-phosphate 3-phosphatidyltransferase
MSDDRHITPSPPGGGGDGASSGAMPAPPVTNWNLPNALTTLRILLVPLFGWLLLVDDGQDTSFRVWAFVVFTLAILTDRIDGEIARSRNLVTDFGKLMDPIADKALTGMAFVGLSIIGELWWWVTIVVLGREWGITLMRFWIIKYGVMPASRGGKIKTTLQAVALCGLILPLRDLDGAWNTVGQTLWWAAVLVMAAAVVVTVVTGADYVREAIRLRREGQAASQTTT